MAKTFEDYVRSGRLQKNFDAAVEKAAREAREHGLRQPTKTPRADNDPAYEPEQSTRRARGLTR